MALSRWLPFRNNQVGALEQDISVPTLSSSASSVNNVEDVRRGWFRRACYGDGFTTSGTRSQLWRMLLLLMVPILILIVLTARSFGQTLSGFITSTKIHTSLRLSIELGILVHSLQRERDYSALHLSLIGPDSKNMLLKTYIGTDTALFRLSVWAVKDENMPDQYDSRDEFLSYLNEHRYMLDSLHNNTIEAELEFYTDTIDRFIKWIYSAITQSRSGLVWKSLVAHQDTIIAKENVGQVRAIGSIYYNRGGFPTDSYHSSLLESQDVANTSLESARRYSSVVFETFNSMYVKNSSLLKDVQAFRKDLRHHYVYNNGTGVEATARRFFDVMSEYLDILLVTQTRLLEKILGILDEHDAADIRKITVIGFVFAFVLIACPMIIKSVYDLTTEMHKYSEALIIRRQTIAEEKERIDRLLYQFLPKPIAKRLKEEMVINPENFKQVTILFSDIVGFTEMSSRSSPMNVVNMLNNLYTAFDERIKTYDAYKVETIGDAYLVASGLPKRNGNQHASEIARLSLDMCYCIRGVEIQHMPGTRFRLRIGCHTGPVATGVVGTKMPRYCLFGETVTIASKMETLSIAGRIHITQTMRDLLISMGGFDITPREDRVIKTNNYLLRAAFDGSCRTYWLHGHESMTGIRIPESPVNNDMLQLHEDVDSFDENDFYNRPFQRLRYDSETELA